METRARGCRGKESGAALVLALLLTMVLLLLGTSILTIAVADRKVSADALDGSRAFHLAEAGVEQAIAELPTRNLDVLLASGGALYTNQSLGGGTCTVSVVNNLSPDFPIGTIPLDPGGATNDTDGYVIIRSTGRYGTAERVIETVGRQETLPDWPYDWGAYGINELSGTGASKYVGNTGTNGTMSFSGVSPKVYGDAWAGSTMTNPTTYVTGTATVPSSSQTFPPVDCPAAPWGPAPSGPHVSFNATTGALSITSTGTTTFAAGTYLFSSISVSGNGIVTMPSGAEVDIYVPGDVSLSGGGLSNPNGTAGSLQFWGCGTAPGDWSISGSVESWFTVYAPTKKLAFSGDSHKHGSFIGLEVSLVGKGYVMYDEGLDSAGQDHFASVMGSWTEVW